MSLLPGDVHAALSQLLEALQSAENIVRSHAEDSLNNDWVAERADVLLMGLAEKMQTNESTQVSNDL